MGSIVKGIGDVVTAPLKAAGDAMGGLVHGAGDLLSGHPLRALGDVVGGVTKGAGEVVHGGLSLAKGVLGNPLAAAGLGFAAMGPLGLLAGPLLGQLGSKVADGADKSVEQLTGAGDQQNSAAFGPNNGALGGGYGMMPGGMMAGGMMPGGMMPGGMMAGGMMAGGMMAGGMMPGGCSMAGSSMLPGASGYGLYPGIG